MKLKLSIRKPLKNDTRPFINVNLIKFVFYMIRSYQEPRAPDLTCNVRVRHHREAHSRPYSQHHSSQHGKPCDQRLYRTCNDQLCHHRVVHSMWCNWAYNSLDCIESSIVI